MSVELPAAPAAAPLAKRQGPVRIKRNDPSDLGTATSLNSRELAEFLLARGAKFDAKSDDGETPLHSAAWAGSSAGAELLLAHGADINAKNSSGETPLQVAEGEREATQLLWPRRMNNLTLRVIRPGSSQCPGASAELALQLPLPSLSAIGLPGYLSSWRTGSVHIRWPRLICSLDVEAACKSWRRSDSTSQIMSQKPEHHQIGN